MSTSSPVSIKFVNRTVLVKKSETSPALLQEVNYGAISSQDEFGVGYSITCIVEANPSFSGQQLLADPKCFIHEYTSSDGLTSKFSRIASLADMDYVLPKSDSNFTIGMEYRSNTLTLIYNDLDTAVASMPVIKDRVSKLYSDRIEILSKLFSDSQPEFLPISATELATQQQYVATYKEKKSARESLDSSVKELQTTYSSSREKQLAVTKMQEFLSIVTNKLNIARTNINSNTTNVASAFGTSILVPIDSKLSSMSDSDTITKAELSGIKQDINSIMLTKIINSTAIFTVPSEGMTLAEFLTALYFEFNGALLGVTQNVYGASAYVNEYLSQLKEAKKSSEVAIAAEVAALANITRYCPDIDTTTL